MTSILLGLLMEGTTVSAAGLCHVWRPCHQRDLQSLVWPVKQAKLSALFPVIKSMAIRPGTVSRSFVTYKTWFLVTKKIQSLFRQP